MLDRWSTHVMECVTTNRRSYCSTVRGHFPISDYMIFKCVHFFSLKNNAKNFVMFEKYKICEWHKNYKQYFILHFRGQWIYWHCQKNLECMLYIIKSPFCSCSRWVFILVCYQLKYQQSIFFLLSALVWIEWRVLFRYRGTATILNTCGECVNPRTPSMLGISPSTWVKVKRWRRDVKNRKSSIFARGSPKHTRLPAWKKYGGKTAVSVLVCVLR